MKEETVLNNLKKMVQNKQSIIIIDLQLMFISYLFAFLLRFDLGLPIEYYKIFMATFPVVITIKILSYIVLELHRIIWRYTGVRDLLKIIKISTLNNSLYALILYGLFQFNGYPRSVIIIDWFLYIMLMGGVRLMYRCYYQRCKKNGLNLKKCLILGAGETAENLIREMFTDNVGYKPVCILDDNPQKCNLYIQGIKVIGPLDDLRKTIIKYHVDEVMIAIPSATPEEMKRILYLIDECRDLNIEYKIVPKFSGILEGRSSVSALREVKIEDLLHRELVTVDQINIRKELSHKTILVTGAAGSIGSELSRQIYMYNPSLLILLDRNENNLQYLEKYLAEIQPKVKYISIIGDVTDKIKLEKIMKEYKPQYIFHAAAYKHVPYMEDYPHEAVRNNVYGSFLVMYYADKYKVEKFILISTDKAVKPTSIMGCTKKIAEMCLQNLFHTSNTNFTVVRFGNVIGSAGSVVPIFQKQIKNGGPVTITHPQMRRYFMAIPEAVRLTLQSAYIGNHGDILILDMGKQIPIVEIAEDLIRLSGLKPNENIEIKFTGMRPGEKLLEELWDKYENPIQTQHPKIYKSPYTDCPHVFNKEIFHRLIKLSFTHNNFSEIFSLLTILVPMYEHIRPKTKHLTAAT